MPGTTAPLIIGSGHLHFHQRLWWWVNDPFYRRHNADSEKGQEELSQTSVLTKSGHARIRAHKCESRAVKNKPAVCQKWETDVQQPKSFESLSWLPKDHIYSSLPNINNAATVIWRLVRSYSFTEDLGASIVSVIAVQTLQQETDCLSCFTHTLELCFRNIPDARKSMYRMDQKGY